MRTHETRSRGRLASVMAVLRRTPTRRMTHALFIAAILLNMLVASQPAQAISRDNVSAALRSTVQVIVPDNDFEIFSQGSGTVMNHDGLILTNHHVVEGDSRSGLMNDDALAFIAVNPPDLRGEAVLKYFGTIVKVDPDLDLALIQIVGLVDDPEAPLPATLGLPAIPIGNSDELVISDEINMFGFPGLGGNTPTYTKGIVAGFLDEDRDGIYEWIKTDAELNHGNSGGLATDELGRFVGVPTAGNTDDVGKIGLVRDGNLALNFVNSYFPNPSGSGAGVTNVQFAEVINRRGQPINPATAFPAGITDLYAVFDYAGFSDGVDFTYIWYTDGAETARDGFAWDGGESGTDWVSVYNDNGLASGFTELEILLDGTRVYRGGVMIGQGNGPTPILTSGGFGPIIFAEGERNGQPTGVATSFSNMGEVYAFFDYEDMTNGTPWATHWYYEGEEILTTPNTWADGASGSFYVSLYHPDGLPAGRFSLELEIDGEIVQTGSFSVQEGGRAAPNAVNVIGVVMDGNNRRTTISGALVILLTPGTSVSDWIAADFADSMIHASGSSNRNGEFQLSAPVVPGEPYSVVVVHDDYEPVTVDDYQIPPDATDPYELEVAMDRS